MSPLRLLSIAILALTAASLPAQKPTEAALVEGDGAVPLFNGKDLAGWVNVNCHPGTFFVKNGEIVTTGNPTGFLRTEKQYENFVLDLDWMHVEPTKMANSGLFVWGDPLPAVGTPYTRGIEVQVLINFAPKDNWATSHGDIFSIHGARCTPDRPHPRGIERCLPSENRVKGAGEWNHYKVIANDGAIKLEVNGKEVSGVSRCTPRKGYLALESEGSECHFKNIKIKELPPSMRVLNPEERAKEWEGHKSLFNGLDLKGWKTKEGVWKVEGGMLKCVGTADIMTEVKFSNCEVMFDWRRPAKSDGQGCIAILESLRFSFDPLPGAKPGTWSRGVLTFKDGTFQTRVEGGKPSDQEFTMIAHFSGRIGFHAAEGLEIMNVFVRELKEKK